MFSTGSEKTRKGKEEVKKIHKAAELAIGSYLKEQASSVIYNSLPINYDKNRCIIQCWVDNTDNLGVKHRTGFDILLWRGNKTWKATIVKVDNNQPIPPKYKKIAPWDYFFKSVKRDSKSK